MDYKLFTVIEAHVDRDMAEEWKLVDWGMEDGLAKQLSKDGAVFSSVALTVTPYVGKKQSKHVLPSTMDRRVVNVLAGNVLGRVHSHYITDAVFLGAVEKPSARTGMPVDVHGIFQMMTKAKPPRFPYEVIPLTSLQVLEDETGCLKTWCDDFDKLKPSQHSAASFLTSQHTRFREGASATSASPPITATRRSSRKTIAPKSLVQRLLDSKPEVHTSEITGSSTGAETPASDEKPPLAKRTLRQKKATATGTGAVTPPIHNEGPKKSKNKGTKSASQSKDEDAAVEEEDKDKQKPKTKTRRANKQKEEDDDEVQKFGDSKDDVDAAVEVDAEDKEKTKKKTGRSKKKVEEDAETEGEDDQVLQVKKTAPKRKATQSASGVKAKKARISPEKVCGEQCVRCQLYNKQFNRRNHVPTGTSHGSVERTWTLSQIKKLGKRLNCLRIGSKKSGQVGSL